MTVKKSKNLKKEAQNNTSVIKRTSGEDTEVLKEGVHVEHTRKHSVPNGSSKMVGANVGVTLNMEDYNSLRVDCWLSDEVGENETHEEAFTRILGIVDNVLNDTIRFYKE